MPLSIHASTRLAIGSLYNCYFQVYWVATHVAIAHGMFCYPVKNRVLCIWDYSLAIKFLLRLLGLDCMGGIVSKNGKKKRRLTTEV